MARRGFVEQVTAGKGYDIQEAALQRLGDEARAEFSQVSTSGQIKQFAEKFEGQLTPEELAEFLGYSNYIGLLFEFQD